MNNMKSNPTERETQEASRSREKSHNIMGAPLCILLSLSLTLTGCLDFENFDCFQDREGCSEPPDTLGEAIITSLDSGERPSVQADLDRGVSETRPPILMDPDGALDMTSGVTPNMTSDMTSDVISDMVFDGDPTDASVDQELPLDPSLVWCRGDHGTRVTVSDPNALTSHLYWSCYRRVTGEYIQILSAELNSQQARALGDHYLDFCDGESSKLKDQLCKPLKDFHSVDKYQDEIREEYQSRVSAAAGSSGAIEALESRQTSYIASLLPYTSLKVSEVKELINLINESASLKGEMNHYQLMSLELWRELTAGIPARRCNSANINVVYKEEGSGGGREGCSFNRPRGVTLINGAVVCRDHLSGYISDEFSGSHMFDVSPLSEDRRFTPNQGELISGELCDLEGNMRELVTHCVTSDQMFTTCTEGWGWEEAAGEDPITEMGSDAQDHEVGIRLIRVYQPHTVP